MKKSNRIIRSIPLLLWQKIDWKKAENAVSTLQNQLVIAVKREDCREEIERLQMIKQKGLCYHCEKPIELKSKNEIHHILPVKDGGTNKMSNLVVVHWVCHGQIHTTTLKEQRAKAKN